MRNLRERHAPVFCSHDSVKKDSLTMSCSIVTPHYELGTLSSRHLALFFRFQTKKNKLPLPFGPAALGNFQGSDDPFVLIIMECDDGLGLGPGTFTSDYQRSSFAIILTILQRRLN